MGKREYPHLENLDLAEEYTDKSELEVSVLLGADHIWKVIKGGGKTGGDTRLPNCYKYRIRMGIKWPCWKHAKNKLSSVNLKATYILKVQSQTETVIKFEDNVLDQQVHMLWDLETIGTIDNDSVHDEFLRNLKFETKKLELLEEYDRLIKGQIKENIVEKFTPTIDNLNTGKIHYNTQL